MGKRGVMLWVLLAGLLLGGGCRSKGPEYYRELTQAEQTTLLRQAQSFVVSSGILKAGAADTFARIKPQVRIVYDGDCRGRAEYRWEIYENLHPGKLTQAAVNPTLIRVYADGDLKAPSWKLAYSLAGREKSSFSAPAPAPDASGNIQVRYRNTRRQP